MQLMHFHTLRSGVQVNASPAPERVLVALEGKLRDLLTRTGLFDNVEVEHTEEPDQLVVGLCQFRQNVSEYAVAEAVEQLWDDDVRFAFWEIHATTVDEGYVEFQAATRESGVGFYATVHLVAQRSAVPAQRGRAV